MVNKEILIKYSERVNKEILIKYSERVNKRYYMNDKGYFERKNIYGDVYWYRYQNIEDYDAAAKLKKELIIKECTFHIDVETKNINNYILNLKEKLYDLSKLSNVSKCENLSLIVSHLMIDINNCNVPNVNNIISLCNLFFKIKKYNLVLWNSFYCNEIILLFKKMKESIVIYEKYINESF